MSYQLYLDDECHECIHYVCPTVHADAWTCVICGLKEEAYPECMLTCYTLRCHHHAHPRCYQKWCKQQKTVGCPTCGPLSYTETNMYCEYCDHFGHSTCIHV